MLKLDYFQIKKISKLLESFIASTALIMLGFSLFGFLLSPVSANAQPASKSNTGIAGFTACTFSQSQASSGNIIQNCLKQIFTFAFVVAIFLIAFRIGIAAIDDYNPFQSGNSANDTITLIWDITLGLILIGGPVLILNTLNPATLNFNFLNLGNIKGGTQTDGSNTNKSSTGSNQTTTGGTATAPSTPISTGIKPETLNDATIVLSDIGKSTSESKFAVMSALDLGFAGNVDKNQFNIFSVNTYASQTKLSSKEAEKAITDVLTIETKCKNLFVDQTTLSDCKIIEQNTWTEARKTITDKMRKEFTPLFDSKTSFYSQNYTLKPIKVLDIQVKPTNLLKSDCKAYYTQIQVQETEPRILLIASEICGQKIDGLAFLKQSGTQVESQYGQSIAEFSQVSSANNIFHIIN